MADPNREHSDDSDDAEVDVEALPSARTVKFHTLRNSLAVGVCGALFEARRAMSAAPGGRLGRCVLAGLNTMTVGAIFFGTMFTPLRCTFRVSESLCLPPVSDLFSVFPSRDLHALSEICHICPFSSPLRCHRLAGRHGQFKARR
jgi:hypothetical protein